MTGHDRWTKPNRLTEVVRHEINKEIVGEFPGPDIEFLREHYSDDFSGIQKGDSVWATRITTRTGLDKESVGGEYYSSLSKAEESLRQLPIGTSFGDGYGYPKRFRELFQGADPQILLGHMYSAGEDDLMFGQCYEALHKAGVKDSRFNTSSTVLEWVGDEHVEWMRDAFGENWTAVAELEYCLNHFADSSLAGLAARVFFAYFVSGDDFSVGYFSKEIEMILGGAEDIASKTKEVQKRAGAAGGKSSHERRIANLEVLMQEIERLAGAVGLISEERILAQAFESTSKRHTEMPKSKKRSLTTKSP